MSFFKKLFGKQNKKDSAAGKMDLTPEQFFNTGSIKALIDKYKRPTTLLRPQKSEVSIAQQQSKFGGVPDFTGFNSYPCCDTCHTPLNFVLQLYKKDFPTFYFPGNANLFQLFRCPNNDCAAAYSEQYDHKMFTYYVTASGDHNLLAKPAHHLPDAEDEVPDCYLKPELTDDFPNYDDFEGDDFVNIEEQFSNDLAELFMDTYSAIPHSKLGGYPAFTQSPVYPTCSCGKTKEFFFQLSSEDPEDGDEKPSAPGNWSPHGIMMGDVGNIYFYVCRSCGQETIESYWDCS